jgi:3-hydroxyacyl-[acyl-carrier-protein] dehydratase
MAVLENIEIRDILPHRYPFLLVDRILEIEADRIVGIKNVTANEPFFTGHFPEFPVMPGVLLIEAMAQVAGVLVLLGVPDRKSKLVLFASIEEAKFRKPVLPGDTLRIEMKILKKKATAVKAQGVVTVDGAMVAEATVMCVVSDKPAKKSEPQPVK